MDFSIYQQPVEPVETRYKEPTEPEFSHYKEPVETHSHYKEAKDSHSLESYVPLPELTDTESQIMSISRNLQLPTSKQIQTPDTDFNLDEIERRNEERLKRFEMVHQPSTGNILDDFMNKRGEKSIPSSPSTYQPIPYEERY
jgi:hypothetical protein